jgi:hypothetical protein
LSLPRPTTSATTLILAGFLVWPWLCLSTILSSRGITPRGGDLAVHGVVRPDRCPVDRPHDPMTFALPCDIDEDLDDGDGDRDHSAGPLEFLRLDPSSWTVAEIRPVPVPADPARIVATHRFRC